MKQWIKGSKSEWYKLVIMVFMVTAFRSAIADWNDVPTGSMEPTILIGDRIFVNKLAYDLKVPYTRIRLARWNEPGPGDIVVLFSPKDGKRLVKRIIAGPGDTVSMSGNRLSLNGESAEYEVAPGMSAKDGRDASSSLQQRIWVEKFEGGEHMMMTMPQGGAFRSFGPVTVPEDHFLVMGDNRDLSADSRVFGFVQRDAIVGKATAVVISVNPAHWYIPRWRRCFTELT